MNIFINEPSTQINSTMQSLPTDILRIIYSYLGVDTIEKHYHATDYLDDILTKEFWIPYFLQYKIPITNQQEEALSWIYEFRVNQLFKIMPIEFAFDVCQYVFKRGFAKGQKCGKIVSPGNNYCNACSKRATISAKRQCIKFNLNALVHHLFSNYYSEHQQQDFGSNNLFSSGTHSMVMDLLDGLDFVYIHLRSDNTTIKHKVSKKDMHQILFSMFESEDIIDYQAILI